MRNVEFVTGEYYHIYNRGTDKRVMFLNDNNFKQFLESLHLLDLLPNNFMPAKNHIRLQAIFENLEIALLFLQFPQTAFARI